MRYRLIGAVITAPGLDGIAKAGRSVKPKFLEQKSRRIVFIANPVTTAGALTRITQMRPLIITSSARLGYLLLCLKHLLFGLEPVVEFRARLITSLDVQFVGSSLDSFLK